MSSTPSTDDLVQRCLEALDRGDRDAVDEVLRAHPDQARAIEERLSRLQKLGLVSAGGAAAPPDRIGPYRVLELLGKGGMGAVYLAEQREPVQRRVALKVLRAGMDTHELLRRFELERQVLALMEHPNIAKVYDAGRADGGSPYIALEYVPGEPLTDYAERRNLTTEHRLELFLSICDAVQHAHHKGIIHRDLKPSNVLVAELEDQPIAKVIDFGVAKATRGGLDVGTLYTEHGRLLGTPEYMSPEQAGTDVFDVDTRADVYSLGVLLYELLTGSLPFDSDRLRRASPSELQRILREEEPKAPSTRVGAATAATNGEGQALRRRLRGDLDWITLRALEKERARRYQSPADLAADVRRHLADDPVAAGPPSRVYRLRKFVRKHRTAVLAAALVVASLLLGVIVSTTALLREAHARRDLESSQRRFQLLALSQRLRNAETTADALVPGWPDRVPALESWMVRFGDALPPKLEEVQRTSRVLEEMVPSPDPESVLGDQEEADQVLLGTLRSVASELEAFDKPKTGLRARMERRLEWAREVRQRSIDDHAEAWRETCAAIAADPRYRMQMTPQLGLVPLGPDPQSGLFEFAHIRSGASPARGPGGVLTITPATAMVFVLVPAGAFWMGAQATDREQPNYDSRAFKGEGPVHRVELGAFFLSKYEMTKGQWRRLGDGSDPSRWPAGEHGFTDACPVETIRWDQANDLLTEHGLALPTEAQWEFACRAGTDSAFWTGDDVQSLVGAANLADRQFSTMKGSHRAGDWIEMDDGFPAYARVDSLRANPWGFHHVHGNVWEWCRDLHELYDTPLDASSERRSVFNKENRIYRGGAYNVGTNASRSAMRFSSPAGTANESMGVRPSRAVRP